MSRRPGSPKRPQRPNDRPVRARPAREEPRAAPESPSPYKQRASDEQKFHGRHACHAVFAHRREDIIRVYVTQERLKEFGELLKWCAEQRRAYHVVESENLERVAETVHHQGIVVLAKKRKSWNDRDLADSITQGTIRGPLLYLDGVQNPHNLGSILRTAAHFGAGGVLGQKDQLPSVTASAARVAEGGAESVPTVRLTNAVEGLTALQKAGFKIFTATNHPGGNVYAATIPERCVIVMGSEVHGVSQSIATIADGSLQIPGTGAVESLNVAVACGVLLSEVARRRESPEKPSQNPGSSARQPSGGSRGKSHRARSRSR